LDDCFVFACCSFEAEFLEGVVGGDYGGLLFGGDDFLEEVGEELRVREHSGD